MFTRILVCLAASFALEAHALGTIEPSPLSDRERSTVEAIMDGLSTQTGAALAQTIINDIDGLADAHSAKAVVRAVKIDAGAKLQTFENILIAKCMSSGGYCILAALQVPELRRKRIRTDDGDSGGGGGGDSGSGGGFGGSPQPNLDGASGNGGFGIGAAGQDFTGQSSSGSRHSSDRVLSAPGPVAGSGLPCLLITWAALATFVGRRRKQMLKSVTFD